MERFQMDIGSFVLFLFSLCITVQWNPKICVFSSSAQKDVNYILVLYMSVKNVWFILEKSVLDEISFFSFGAFFV